ncbi:hypothetical protein [Microbacterium halophytorum]|uniref:hypothetical protein n=1 Tax=Microbacterium halophytorum TaxID=2067568 RepID=UPI000CFAA128|nr:hypothetical protein [Microbacterium halophytorum]
MTELFDKDAPGLARVSSDADLLEEHPIEVPLLDGVAVGVSPVAAFDGVEPPGEFAVRILTARGEPIAYDLGMRSTLGELALLVEEERSRNRAGVVGIEKPELALAQLVEMLLDLTNLRRPDRECRSLPLGFASLQAFSFMRRDAQVRVEVLDALLGFGNRDRGLATVDRSGLPARAHEVGVPLSCA